MSRISIPADLEAWATAEVAAGRAESVEELVAALLREKRDSAAFVQAKLAEARSSLARGDGIALGVVLDEIDTWIAEDEAEAASLRSASS